MLDEESPKICIIGGGLGGICAAVRLRQKLNIAESITLFDENKDVGGTWLVNNYPGCACDVPSHMYSYSFERNSNWSKQYPERKEILEYIRNVAKKYDVLERIKFEYRVTSLKWDEIERKWNVTVLNKKNGVESMLKFDIVILAVGVLRMPNKPPQFEAFKGPKFHTAEWNLEVDLVGKIVAIVGTGASAVQVIPKIVDNVKELIVYQRSPSWIFPRIQFEYPEWIQKTLEKVPGLMWAWRCFLFWWFEYTFWAFKLNNPIRMAFKIVTERFFKHQVKDQDLRAKLTPNYELGCKRVAPSSDYYPALSKPNVTIINSPIKIVTGNSIINEDGTHRQPDVLILATGFKTQDFFAPLKIYGNGGEDLFQKWKKGGPSIYLGILCHSAPNLFFLTGPTTITAHNSLLFQMECQVEWMVNVIGEMIKRKAGMVAVKKFAEKEYMELVQSSFEGTVWTGNCGAWYANEHGMMTLLWPKSLVSYYFNTRRVDYSKLEFLSH